MLSKIRVGKSSYKNTILDSWRKKINFGSYWKGEHKGQITNGQDTSATILKDERNTATSSRNLRENDCENKMVYLHFLFNIRIMYFIEIMNGIIKKLTKVESGS